MSHRNTYKLTALQVRNIQPTGRDVRYHDGGGLYLRVRARGSKEWQQRLSFEGRQSYYSLGPARKMSLAEARATARANTNAVFEYQQAQERGENPPLPAFIAKRRGVAAESGISFGSVWEKAISTFAVDWSEKNRERDLRHWRADLQTHLKDVAPLPVASISVACLRQARDRMEADGATSETRLRVFRRASRVFVYAVANDYARDNPAQQLRDAMPKKRNGGNHRPALAWKDVPGFYRSLVADGTGADARGALAFLILTGVRSGEAAGARWEEIDMDAAMWTIPGSRMKDGREHKAPLSDAALAVLRAAGVKKEGLVFRSPQDREIAGKRLLELLRELGVTDTVHGFRSSLRDWCADHGIAFDVAEMSLAHRVGGSVVQAYHRSDILDRRRVEVMAPWGAFVAGGRR